MATKYLEQLVATTVYPLNASICPPGDGSCARTGSGVMNYNSSMMSHHEYVAKLYFLCGKIFGVATTFNDWLGVGAHFGQCALPVYSPKGGLLGHPTAWMARLLVKLSLCAQNQLCGHEFSQLFGASAYTLKKILSNVKCRKNVYKKSPISKFTKQCSFT